MTQPTGTPPNSKIPVSIQDEMRTSYLDYAMSVIIGRAIPDVRDGLKPVHRRILFSAFEQNLLPGSAHRKSASIVGDVLAKYHPHGDASVYDAMVRLAQEVSLRYPLIDGRTGIEAAQRTGRGTIIMRSRMMVEKIEGRGDREQLVVTEIPYQVNKARVHAKIGELIREKKIEGISEVRDESDREGIRLV